MAAKKREQNKSELSTEVKKVEVKTEINTKKKVVNPLKKELAGKIISINLKQETGFAYGDIVLDYYRYWATISDNMKDDYYTVINNSIKAGSLVLGKQRINPLEKDKSTLEEYLEVFSRGMRNDILKKMEGLVQNGHDRNWTVAEVVNYLRDHETKGRNRRDILGLLIEYEKFHNGPINRLPPWSEEEGKSRELRY
jgi:hypothetical protein